MSKVGVMADDVARALGKSWLHSTASPDDVVNQVVLDTARGPFCSGLESWIIGGVSLAELLKAPFRDSPDFSGCHFKSCGESEERRPCRRIHATRPLSPFGPAHLSQAAPTQAISQNLKRSG